ncbi:MAG TPA: MarR family transcriptional regulator [Candidatus Acidoferrales bacterium]|nr:MarR family transcriptional regulator [Candidatus Acidoferrales bacterium]
MNADSLRPILELHRATHAVDVFIARLPDIGVTQAEAIILAFLHGKADATIAELHRAFGHRRSTLTNVVDRLVERGLATREVSLRDRRSFIIRLTRSGASLSKKPHAALADLARQSFGAVSERDLAAFQRVLSRLIEASERR